MAFSVFDDVTFIIKIVCIYIAAEVIEATLYMQWKNQAHV